jgi:hypothetical protein
VVKAVLVLALVQVILVMVELNQVVAKVQQLKKLIKQRINRQNTYTHIFLFITAKKTTFSVVLVYLFIF